MRVFCLGAVLAVALTACAGTPSHDAVVANQQRAFKQCVERRMLKPTPIELQVSDPGHVKREHGFRPPPSPTPDINTISQACL